MVPAAEAGGRKPFLSVNSCFGHSACSERSPSLRVVAWGNHTQFHIKERIMAPSKEQVRQWLSDRRDAKAPPPSPEEVRRQLGWDMMREMDKQRQETSR